MNIFRAPRNPAVVEQNVTVRCFIAELLLKVFLGVKPPFDCSELYYAVLSSLSGGLLVGAIKIIIMKIIIISSFYITLLCKVSQSAFQRSLVCSRKTKIFSSGPSRLV